MPAGLQGQQGWQQPNVQQQHGAHPMQPNVQQQHGAHPMQQSPQQQTGMQHQQPYQGQYSVQPNLISSSDTQSMLQATGTAKMILEQTERMSQQVNSAVRGQQMSDTELDLTARAAEEVLSTVMRARMSRQTMHAGRQQGAHPMQPPMQQEQQSLPPLQQQSPGQQVPQSSHSLSQQQQAMPQQQHT